MKPISLTISGLHSFRELQTIDFTQVTDTGIFGIFGPTGSGKSTILDAMTLALYGEVERSEANRAGLLNQQEEKIHVKFIFELHTGAQYENYTVERVYARNKEQKIRSSIARLIRMEDGQAIPLADKETEVTRMVQQLLGLEFKDFKRAVVLPQGKFADFLTLKAQERRPMLERIFHLDEYGKQLKDRANQHESQLKEQINEIKIKQEMLSSANEEYLHQLEQEITLLKSSIQKQIKENELFLLNFDQLQQIWNLQQELEKLRKELQTLQLKEGNINQLKEKQANAEKASQIEPTLRHYKALEKQKEEYEQAIHQSKQNLEMAKQVEMEDQKVWEEKSQLFEQEQKTSVEKRFHLTQALQWEREVQELQERIDKLALEQAQKIQELERLQQQHDQDRELLTKINQQILEIKEKQDLVQISTDRRKKIESAWSIRSDMVSLKTELNRRNLELRDIEKNTDDLQQEIETKEDIIRDMDKEFFAIEGALETHRCHQPISEIQWNAQDRSLVQLEGKLNQVLSDMEKRKKLEEEKKSIAEEKEQLEKKRDERDQEILHLEEQLTREEISRKALEKRELEHYAVILAEQLEEGKPCLICGSTHHPAPVQQEQVSESTFLEKEELQQRIEMLSTTLQQKREELISLDHQIHFSGEQIIKVERELEEQMMRFQEVANQLPAQYQELEPEQMSELYTQEQESHQKQKLELDHWLKRQKELEEKYQQLKADLEKQRHQFELLNGKLGMYQEQMAAVRKAKEPLEQNVNQLQEQWKQGKFEFQMDELEAIRKQIDDFDHQREELEKEFKELNESLQVLSLRERNEAEEITQLKVRIDQAANVLEIDMKRLNEVYDNLIMLTKGEPVIQLIEELDLQLNSLKGQLESAKNRWEQSSASVKQYDMQLNSEQAVHSSIENQLQQANSELIRFLQSNHWQTIEELEGYLLTNEELKRIKEEISQYERQQQGLFEQEKIAMAKLNGRSLTEDKWQNVLNEKNEREEQVTQMKQELARKEFEYQQVKQNFEQWVKYEKARIEVQKQLDIASELNQVLRGNSFIDFIAQEYLQNITVIASEKLLQLTRNRFRLEVDEEGMFQIVDEYNGGLSRPVRSLSGGETFLTSLALALALSSQIQLKGGVPLEFFFLDEGFGTLDTDLLDTVMMTLEKLHVEHMTIGIISHVPELKNRLHRKILVQPANDRGKGSTIVIES